MKRVLLILTMVIGCFLLASCEKETMLTVNQSSLSFNNSGGSQTVNLLANKVWSASSNQGWCKVSPSSGDGSDNSNFTLSVSCEANVTYDERSCTITIVCEELTSTISVAQAEGKGLIVSQTEYSITNEAQTISVEVQANVQYSVEIDDACKTWIKQESTKGLSSNTIKFAISKNEDYDGREGKITVKQTDGSLSGTVVVKQSQKNELIAEKTSINVSAEEQSFAIKVRANVKYEVQINEDWLIRIKTKGLTEETLSFKVAKNEGEARIGKILLKSEEIQEEITVTQETEGYVDFDDANFKSYCLTRYDKNNDGELSFVEARTISRINVTTNNISSIKGIEYMPALSSLICRAEYQQGILKKVDVSKNTALKEFDCSNNQLSNLDISNNTGLSYLWCNGNQLTNLDISNNSALDFVYCYNNLLKSIVVSENNQALTILSCSRNRLSSLDVNKLTSLKELICSSNQLSSLDVTHNTVLSWLWCDENQLTSLDVTHNPALEKLVCGENLLKSIDVSNNEALTELRCLGNQLTSLDLSNNAALVILWCNNNQLSSLDLQNNTALEHIICNSNQLTSLDLSRNTALRKFDCIWNQLTSLDLSNNTALMELDCGRNLLRNLDVSKNTALTQLDCYQNQITSLDVSNNTALKSLACGSNQLTKLDLSKNPLLISLDCYGNQLTNLDVSNNTALEYLNCWDTKVSSLDVSKSVALSTLQCGGNQLTSLDVSNNTMLRELDCRVNPLLTEIWLKTNQTIPNFKYDTEVATIKYK